MPDTRRNIANLLVHSTQVSTNGTVVADRSREIGAEELASSAKAIAGQLENLGIVPGDRVAIIVDKQVEVIVALFGCFLADAVLVPVNPQLKPRQIQHILSDSGARIIIGAAKRTTVLERLEPELALPATITASFELQPASANSRLAEWHPPAPGFENKPLATLFYTSGSTGLPKAVACTHDNILSGAESVSTYLENSASDVILAILPLSFDAGFSQLTTGLLSGARIILQDYLLPTDISRACQRHGVTGITGVPAIWNASLRANWTKEARQGLRYFANTGGHLSHQRIVQLTELFPNARPYSMYGLTEAFRSTYLHPDMIWKKPGSIGKAIPGAVLCVVDENGEECPPDQPGELVHAGPTVAAGYWNNPDETEKRFRSAPAALRQRVIEGTVVFSGDLVRRDAEGFLFYETRIDSQIKISGNRLSFTEIEDVALAHPDVRACAAGGRKSDLASDPELVLFVETDGPETVAENIMEQLRAELPGYAVPSRVIARRSLILNNNNKYDVKRMIAEYCSKFPEGVSSGTD